jgi:hypothetical protein
MKRADHHRRSGTLGALPSGLVEEPPTHMRLMCLLFIALKAISSQGRYFLTYKIDIFTFFASTHCSRRASRDRS